MKRFTAIIIICLISMTVCGCNNSACRHDWDITDMTHSRVCNLCGVTECAYNEHIFTESRFSGIPVCSECGFAGFYARYVADGIETVHLSSENAYIYINGELDSVYRLISKDNMCYIVIGGRYVELLWNKDTATLCFDENEYVAAKRGYEKPVAGDGIFGYINNTPDCIADSEEKLRDCLEYIFFNYFDAQNAKTVTVPYLKTTEECETACEKIIQDTMTFPKLSYDAGYDFALNGDGVPQITIFFKTDGYDYNGRTVLTEDIEFTECKLIPFDGEHEKRSDGFDGFPIYDRKISVSVRDTTQLIYAVEHGILPVCESGSQAEAVYEKAKAALREICSDDMTEYEKVNAIHSWILESCVYDYAAVKAYKTYIYEAHLPEGVFNSKSALCDGMAKAFTLMCGIENIGSYSVRGTSAYNQSHRWAKVRIGADGYVVDLTGDEARCEIDGTHYSFGIHRSYLLTDGEYERTHTALTDWGFDGNGSFDYYKDTAFTIGDYEGNLTVESTDELSYLFEYCLEQLDGGIYCVDFEFDLDTGESWTDELKEAVGKAEARTGKTNLYDCVLGKFEYTDKTPAVLLLKDCK